MTPKLLNAIFAEIQQVDEAKTVFSAGRREPSPRVVKGPAFRVPAQVFFAEHAMINGATSAKTSSRELSGVLEDADGYLIVRRVDLAELGKAIKNGDRLVRYGKDGNWTTCEYYMVGMKPAAHYTDAGGMTLEKWYFQDRN